MWARGLRLSLRRRLPACASNVPRIRFSPAKIQCRLATSVPDVSAYLQLTPTTIETLHDELNSHAELMKRMENDFSSLTIKDHKRFGILEGLVSRHERWLSCQKEYKEASEMVEELKGGKGSDGLDEEDAEMLVLAEEEAAELRGEMLNLEQEIWELLLPRDEADANNVLLETKAGVGGAEASLFTEEIFNMYKDFAQRQGFKFETLEVGERPEGGYRYATASIQALPGAESGEFLQKLVRRRNTRTIL